ncbi:LEM domain-containing protein 1 isoform X2 [Myripristis murdjan]|nr:lamina-associated polypeptide 2, isoforms beta/delta/epsilon/gamma-like isoform X2 [Myripristis murdjan]
MLDLADLTDDDLKAMLLKHGVKAGPIVGSTRALYERKLKKLLEPDAQHKPNGTGDGALYSDSEEEEEDREEEEEEELDSEQVRQERAAQLEEAQQEISQAELCLQNGDYVYPQCFLMSSRLRACASRHWEPRPKRNAGNVVELSSEWSRSQCSQIPIELSRTSSLDEPTGLGSRVPPVSQSDIIHVPTSSSSRTFSITQMVEEMESQSLLSSSTDRERELNGSIVEEHWSRANRLDMLKRDKCTMKNQSLYYTPKASPYELAVKLTQEPVTDIPQEILPDSEPTPTGIHVTRRRPIKGAAGRPIQYKYPDTPVSPMTRERQEVERRLVPIYIQILVFLIVACLLYLIYAYVEDNSFNPFVALLDSLNQESGSEEGHLLQAETQDTPVLDTLTGQE